MKNLFPWILSVFILLALLMATSCTPIETPEPPTKTELITAKTWKLTAWTLDPALPFKTGGPAVSNWYAQLGNCGKDDIYKFNSGSYAFEEGATKCNANDPTVFESGNWNFNTNETVVLMKQTSPKASNYEYKLKELTQTQLVLVLEIQSTGGTVYTSTQTFAPN